MTDKEFRKLRPGKSIIKTIIDGVEKTMLFKFFLCNPPGEPFDGYWMLCTEDMKNPEPYKILDSDWETYDNLCDVISF